MDLSKMMSAALLLAATCMSCSSDNATETPASGKTFLLVHGAWMGAWCWADVTKALRAQGATVDTVELPAHGDDMTLLAKLVYLGAYLPKDGQSLLDLAMTDAESHLGQVSVADPTTGLVSVPSASLKDVFVADGSDAEVDELKQRYRDEPLAPFVTPAHTSAKNWGSVPKVYLYTKEDHAVSYALQRRMTQGVTLVSSAELDTSHSPFLSQPTLTAATLAAL